MKKIISVLAVLSMVFGIAAFQCSSTEITSAKLYIQQKNFDKAIESLEKEVAKNPKSDEGYFLLGDIYREQGDYFKMVENFDKSLAVSNKFAADISNRKLNAWADSFNKGVAFFNRANKTESADSIQMNFDKAIKNFDAAIMLEPDSAAAYKNLTFAYLNMERNEDAVKTLEALLARNKTAEDMVMLGQILSDIAKKYMDEGSQDKANKEYDKIISLMNDARKEFPNNNEFLLILSNAYVNSNRLDEAMDAFRAGVEKDPSNKGYRYNLGVLYLGANDFPNAEIQFNEALKIDPNYINAIYNLAVTYVKWGSKMRDESIEKDEESNEYLGMYEKALPYLEKYLEVNPEEGAIWDLIGKVYTNLGQNEKAENAYNKAKEFGY